MDISVPLYDAEGFHFVWEDGFFNTVFNKRKQCVA